MKFTGTYRELLSDRVDELEEQSNALRTLWVGEAKDLSLAATVNRSKDLIKEVRKTLDAVEEVFKEDLYQNVANQVRGEG